MKIAFEILRCSEKHLNEIMAIQDEAFAHLANPDLLRRNSKQMLTTCLLAPHVTLGAFLNGAMIGFSILYFGEKTDENLGLSLGFSGDELFDIANFKLVIVRPEYRGNSIQYTLMSELEKIALKRGIKLLCTTVHPDNIPSKNNIEKCNYVFVKHFDNKYGGLSRSLYIKNLEDDFYDRFRKDIYIRN